MQIEKRFTFCSNRMFSCGNIKLEQKLCMNPAPAEAAEVADTFLLPLRVLRQHAPEVYVRQLAVEAPDFPYGDAGVTADYPWRPYRLEVPVFRGLPHPLWGITARITMAVLEKL